MSDGILSIALLLVVLCPLLIASLMAFNASRAIALRFAPWAALPALILALSVPLTTSLSIPWLMLGTELALMDEFSRTFLVFTSLLWWLAGVYAGYYFSSSPKIIQFFIFFLMTMTGNLGLILAQEAVSFYMFFALMSFSAYGLVAHERSQSAQRAGLVYIVFVVLGEIALFAGLVLICTAAGSTQFATLQTTLIHAESRDLIILLISVGFGIKAGVVGLHMWLPLAHPVAPTPASAVLSGAMIKAGLVGWLRLLPMGQVALPEWGVVFMFMGVFAAFYAVVVGLTQQDAKTLLAYSSISQMGLMIMTLGVGMTEPETYPVTLSVITFYALHHSLSKGALFLGVGVIRGSHGMQRFWTWLMLWVPALSLAGAPLTSGMLAKLQLKERLVVAPDAWAAVLPVLLPWSSVATVLLVGRLLYLLARPVVSSLDHTISLRIVGPWLLLIVAVLLVPGWAADGYSMLWIKVTDLSSLWPLLLGGGVALTVILGRLFMTPRESKGAPTREWQPTIASPAPLIPPGDVLLPITLCVTAALTLARRLAQSPMQQCHRKWFPWLRQPGLLAVRCRSLERIEHKLKRWRTAIVLFLLLGSLVGWLGMAALIDYS